MSPQRLGQHFLADASWRARIRRSLCVEPDDVWLEIGAGHGEMTREIARSARRVVAVELDAPLVERLRELAEELPNVCVVAGDVLELDLQKAAGAARFRVFGSLPYYITSPILRRLFDYVRDDVLHATNRRQQPFVYGSLPGERDFFFVAAR
mgnify:CR=1 FL=1